MSMRSVHKKYPGDWVFVVTLLMVIGYLKLLTLVSVSLLWLMLLTLP